MEPYAHRNSLYFTVDPESIEYVYNYLKYIEVDINRIMVLSGRYNTIQLDTTNIHVFNQWIRNIRLPLLLIKVDTNSYFNNEDTYEIYGDDNENVLYIVGNFITYYEDFNSTRFRDLLDNHNVSVLYTDDDGEYRVSIMECTTRSDIADNYIQQIMSLFPDVVVLYRAMAMPCLSNN